MADVVRRVATCSGLSLSLTTVVVFTLTHRLAKARGSNVEVGEAVLDGEVIGVVLRGTTVLPTAGCSVIPP